MSEQLQGYGGNHVEDTDASLRSKSGGKFGLNTPARVSKLAYRAAEGENAEAIEIFISLGEREFKNWIGPITRVYVKNPEPGSQGTVPVEAPFTTDAAIKVHNEELAQHKAILTHTLKALGVTEDSIRMAATQPASSFAEYAQRMVSLVPAGYNSKEVDLFLEYQYQPGKDQTVTFVQMPKNMKGGYFLVAAQPGPWTEGRDDKGGLVYKNAAGAEHPFNRSKDFMESKKAYQSDLSGNRSDGQASAQSGNNPMTQAQAGNGQAKQSTWNTQT